MLRCGNAVASRCCGCTTASSFGNARESHSSTRLNWFRQFDLRRAARFAVASWHRQCISSPAVPLTTFVQPRGIACATYPNDSLCVLATEVSPTRTATPRTAPRNMGRSTSHQRAFSRTVRRVPQNIPARSKHAGMASKKNGPALSSMPIDRRRRGGLRIWIAVDVPVVDDVDFLAITMRISMPTSISRPRLRSSIAAALESHIDDPIRMYLMQMGEIPMLTRELEITLGQSHRKDADPFPPHAAGQRLRAAGCRRTAGKGAERRAAARSHDRNLGDQHRRKETDLKRLAPNLAHDQAPDAAQSARLPHGRRARLATKPRSDSAWRRLVVRRNKIVRLVEELNLADRATAADHAAVAARSASGWRRSNGSSSTRARSSARSNRRACRRAPLLDANHAGNARDAGPADRPHARSPRTSMTPPSATCRPPTCGSSFRSPSGIAIAA